MTSAAFDVCLTDVCLEGDDGFTLLEWCGRKNPDLPVVLMTGYGGPDAAIDAVASGAFDLLTKPLIDDEEMFLPIKHDAAA